MYSYALIYTYTYRYLSLTVLPLIVTIHGCDSGDVFAVVPRWIGLYRSRLAITCTGGSAYRNEQRQQR